MSLKTIITGECNALLIVLHLENLARSGQENFVEKRGTFCEKTVIINLADLLHSDGDTTYNGVGR